MDNGSCELCLGYEDVKIDLVLPTERSVAWNLYINICWELAHTKNVL